MKNVAEIWPLAPLQELMLTHALADRDSTLLIEQFHCTIRGPLDAGALRQAWETILRRHPLLRAAPAWEGLKKTVQVVRREVTLPWQELDWRGLSEEECAAQSAQLISDSREEGFHLSKPPLLRLHLAQVNPHEWFFVWTCHHLVLDGWSLAIILSEVFQCYERLRVGLSIELPPVGSFADYLQWMAARDPEQTTIFWREQLAGTSSPRRLSIEQQCPAFVSSPSAFIEREVCIGEPNFARLIQTANAWRVSPSVLVNAAWGILLARYDESEAVTIGTAVSGRPPQVPHIETIAGPFVNNVPLRIVAPLDGRVAEVCQQLQATQLARQPFECTPLAMIGAAAGRTEGRLFDSLVVYENYPLHHADARQSGDLTLHDMHGTATSAFPLTLVAFPGRELLLRLRFDSRRYSEESAAGLLEQTATVLRNGG